MVRQALFIVVLVLCPRVAEAEQACGPQSYESTTPPDFSCPSPGEADLVPQMDAPRSLAVEAGEQVEVPFAGALVARERLQLMGLRLQAVRRLRWLDQLQLRQRTSIERAAAAQVHEAEREHLVAYRDQYQRLVERGWEERTWYRSYWFGFLCGAVAAIVLGGLAIYGLSQLQPDYSHST